MQSGCLSVGLCSQLAQPLSMHFLRAIPWESDIKVNECPVHLQIPMERWHIPVVADLWAPALSTSSQHHVQKDCFVHFHWWLMLGLKFPPSFPTLASIELALTFFRYWVKCQMHLPRVCSPAPQSVFLHSLGCISRNLWNPLSQDPLVKWISLHGPL